MDPRRFDALTKSVAATGTRRDLLRRFAPLPLAGLLVALLGQEPSRADGSGAVSGGGHRRRHRHRPNHRDRRDNDNDNDNDKPDKNKNKDRDKDKDKDKSKKTCGKTCGPCKRCEGGACTPKRDGTVCRGNGVCTDGTCKKDDPTPATCPGEGLPCDTNPGTQCCPDVDPNVLCAGGLTGDLVCQDCTRPLTAAGAFCQDQPGNQCCDGSPGCFVGVRVGDDQQPVCLSDGSCNGTPCANDADCPRPGESPPQPDDYTVCVRNDASPDTNSCGCVTRTTICGRPCDTP
jgi:hypothetical protein